MNNINPTTGHITGQGSANTPKNTPQLGTYHPISGHKDPHNWARKATFFQNVFAQFKNF